MGPWKKIENEASLPLLNLWEENQKKKNGLVVSIRSELLVKTLSGWITILAFAAALAIHLLIPNFKDGATFLFLFGLSSFVVGWLRITVFGYQKQFFRDVRSLKKIYPRIAILLDNQLRSLLKKEKWNKHFPK